MNGIPVELLSVNMCIGAGRLCKYTASGALKKNKFEMFRTIISLVHLILNVFEFAYVYIYNDNQDIIFKQDISICFLEYIWIYD